MIFARTQFFPRPHRAAFHSAQPASTPIAGARPVSRSRASVLAMAAVVFALALLAAQPVLAGGTAANLQEAIAQVQRETGGRVLSADTVMSGNREVYRIKVLTPDGRVRVVTKQSRVSGRR